MPRVTKGVLWSEVEGQKVALSQTYGADGEPQLVSEATPMPIKGSVQLSGSIVQETKSETNAANGVVTFSKTIKQIGIFNKSNTDGNFNVNGLDIFVPARGSFTNPIGGTPRATVTITGATSYSLLRYE